jgi:hypothetical protein
MTRVARILVEVSLFWCWTFLPHEATNYCLKQLSDTDNSISRISVNNANSPALDSDIPSLLQNDENSILSFSVKWIRTLDVFRGKLDLVRPCVPLREYVREFPFTSVRVKVLDAIGMLVRRL